MSIFLSRNGHHQAKYIVKTQIGMLGNSLLQNHGHFNFIFQNSLNFELVY